MLKYDYGRLKNSDKSKAIEFVDKEKINMTIKVKNPHYNKEVKNEHYENEQIEACLIFTKNKSLVEKHFTTLSEIYSGLHLYFSYLYYLYFHTEFNDDNEEELKTLFTITLLLSEKKAEEALMIFLKCKKNFLVWNESPLGLPTIKII